MCKSHLLQYTCAHVTFIPLGTCLGYYRFPGATRTCSGPGSSDSGPSSGRDDTSRKCTPACHGPSAPMLTIRSRQECGTCQRTVLERQLREEMVESFRAPSGRVEEDGWAPVLTPEGARRQEEREEEFGTACWRLSRQFPDVKLVRKGERRESDKRRRGCLLRQEVMSADVILERSRGLEGRGIHVMETETVRQGEVGVDMLAWSHSEEETWSAGFGSLGDDIADMEAGKAAADCAYESGMAELKRSWYIDDGIEEDKTDGESHERALELRVKAEANVTNLAWKPPFGWSRYEVGPRPVYAAFVSASTLEHGRPSLLPLKELPSTLSEATIHTEAEEVISTAVRGTLDMQDNRGQQDNFQCQRPTACRGDVTLMRIMLG